MRTEEAKLLVAVVVALAVGFALGMALWEGGADYVFTPPPDWWSTYGQ